MARPPKPRRRGSRPGPLFNSRQLGTRYSQLTVQQLEQRYVLSTFTVSTTANSGAGSLPAEVALANAATDAAIINFADSAGGPFATAQTITLAQTVSLSNTNSGASIEIEGPTAGVTISGGGAGSDFGVMAVAAGTTASIVGASASDPITITDGNETSSTEFGAGIDNAGTLTITAAVVTNNSSQLSGGGIRNELGATLLVNGSTISNNVSNDLGGGISNLGTAEVNDSTISGNSLTGLAPAGAGIDNQGTLTVLQSTISGNTSPNKGLLGGGGLANENGSTAKILNSTFSGNKGVNGGAIDNSGFLDVINCTLSGNMANLDAGGIDNTDAAATMALENSIVAGNSVAAGGTNDDLDLGRSNTAANNDLIGSFSTGVQNGGLAGGINGNEFGPPLLAPLANYGGNTQTFALLPGSQALSAGGPVTTLAANISATATTIHVNRNFTLPNPVLGQGYDLLLEQEEMQVTAVSGTVPNYTLTVVRGVNGTKAVKHSAGGANGIFLATDQRGMPTSVVGVTDMGAFQSQGFNVTVQSGDSPQLTPVSTAFAKPLGVTVTANNAKEPVNGGIIGYTVNPGSNGGSANLSSSSVTISGGKASVTATANSTADSYTVDASAIPSNPGAGAEFDLTNAPLNELIWSGGSSSSSNWSDPANWDLNREPKSGDDLVFPDNAQRTTNTDDISGLSVHSITFQNTQTTPTAAYVIGGQALTIGAGGILDGTAGDNSHQRVDQLNMNLTLGASQTWNMGTTSPSFAPADFATLVLGGAVHLGASDLTCTGGSAQDVFAFNGVIDGTGKVSVSMSFGFNFVSLDHANSYTGGTEVVSGDLAATADGALGAGGTSDGGTVIDSAPAGNEAVIDFATSYSTPEKLTVMGGAANSAGSGIAGGLNPVTNKFAPASFAGPITLSGATVFIESISGALTLTGNIAAGSTAVTVADRAPTPATVVLDGLLTGTSKLNVDSNVGFPGGAGGATTLAGTATANFPVTVATGSTLQPGDPTAATTTGTLNAADVTFQSGSTFATQLNGTAAGQFDQLNSTGTVTLGGATLNVTSAGGFAPATPFVIIKSANPIVGTFKNLAEGATVSANGQSFTISYLNDQVTLTVSGTAVTPGSLAFSAATYNANATDGTATITIDRTNGSSGAVSVTVNTSDGTGKAGTDYTTTNQVVNWADGDSAPKTVSIPLLIDIAASGTTKTVNLTLTGASGGATLGTQSTAILDISENGTVAQPGQLAFSAASYNANATDGTATITIDRANGSSGAVSVTVSTSDGTGKAGTDYTTTNQVVNWADGDSAPKTVSIPLLVDTAASGTTKTVNLTLTRVSGGATLGTQSTAILNINENGTVAEPGQLTFSAATYNANATDGTATITIDRANGSSGAVSVTVSTSDGTGKVGTDYTTTNQVVNWADGDSAPKTVNIPLLVDTAANGATKTVNLTLTGPSGGATLGSQSTAVLDINENGTVAQPGQLAFSAATYTANATDGTATITIDRAGGSSGAVSVVVSTSDGTGKAGTDYTTTTQTVNWADGDSAPKTVSVPLLLDTAASGTTKTVNLTLTSPSGGATLGTQSTAVLDVNENGTAPLLGNAQYREGQAGDGSDATLIHNLYRNLLGREPDSGGQTFWLNILDDNGSLTASDAASREQVVQGFLNSPEYKLHFVIGLYENFLHRAPDAGGLQFWLDVMNAPGTPGAGTDEKLVVASFVASPEYYLLHGGTAQSWIAAAYVDLLGRSPDGGGQSFWTGQLSATGDRDAVILGVLGTPEAEQKLLDAVFPASATIPAPGAPAPGPSALGNLTGDGWENVYLQGSVNLGSTPSDTFFAELAAGTPWDSLIEQMLDSQQYYNRAQQGSDNELDTSASIAVLST